ncbi:nuclear transport factor 2 family protein [Lacibacter luteus]|uniref:Nuclear transport factor 2 family protein n=1 Tax=Lacibacter luteus TaxID=2508719 RepID=A0A4Q1CHA6_9BACT|nr:nuclear transport factor 2 family protein [Lacibacter luteus]RXK59640.1 nuclear transport factor 2 family protein [Lacibacter luteus]
MKQLILSVLLTIVLGFNSIAQSKQETAVANAVEKLRLAMISGNEAELRAVTSDKLSYGHSGGLVENQEQFLEKFKTGASDFVTIELKNQTISVSGKVAIVRHELHGTNNDNNKPGEVHLRILLVFEKSGKEWKMLARQAVKITP